MSPQLRFPLRVVALLGVLVLIAAACSSDEPSDTGEPSGGATLTFGTSADPVVLDGALVSDGESLRVIDQIFEGLVALRPGGTEIEPGLAESWVASDDGLDWTFTLRPDVRFHDGEAFDAAAVCTNFDRWYNFPDPFRAADATYYWQTVFGGFAGDDFSLFESCSADDDLTVTLSISQPSSSFLSALALTNFTFASPKALDEFGADEGEVGDDGLFRPTGTYGTEHPSGTGPFMFKEWTRNDRLVLERNEDYWGDFPGNIDTLIFRPIPDNAARLQALQTGEIQGYDLVEPQDFASIEGDPDLQLLERPAFNVGYVGFNQAIKPMDDLAVRQAIAYATNRQEIVDAFYAGQGEVAHEFMPPSLFGYAPDVTQYPYDPDLAKSTLTDAGFDLPVAIGPFAFPTDVSRPYMPDPQANFEAIVADLEECCFKVKKTSATWSPDYLGKADTGKYAAYLLGWTGDFGDPDNFVGTFFQTPQDAWGFDNEQIFGCLDEAEQETDEGSRATLYQECNRLIMDFLPGLPYVHTKPALAFAAFVTGYQPSPVSLEPFSLVTVGEV